MPRRWAASPVVRRLVAATCRMRRGHGRYETREPFNDTLSVPGLAHHGSRVRPSVERSIARVGRYRCPSRAYEYLPTSSEAMVYLTLIRLLLARLARSERS